MKDFSKDIDTASLVPFELCDEFEVVRIVAKNALGQKASQYQIMELWNAQFTLSDRTSETSLSGELIEDRNKVFEEKNRRIKRRYPDIDSITLTEGTDYVFE